VPLLPQVEVPHERDAREVQPVGLQLLLTATMFGQDLGPGAPAAAVFSLGTQPGTQPPRTTPQAQRTPSSIQANRAAARAADRDAQDVRDRTRSQELLGNPVIQEFMSLLSREGERLCRASSYFVDPTPSRLTSMTYQDVFKEARAGAPLLVKSILSFVGGCDDPLHDEVLHPTRVRCLNNKKLVRQKFLFLFF